MIELKILLEEKLREAAHLGDLKTIQELLQGGVDINSQNKVNGWTALHWAAYRNHYEVVDYLLKCGANQGSLTNKGESPYKLTTSKEVQIRLEGMASEKMCQELLITPNYLLNQPLFVSNVQDTGSKSKTSTPYVDSKNELILKVRVAGSSDPDFIEIEVPKSDLTLERLTEICSEELEIDSSSISKIRKLPNTILKKDKDVQRLSDFQELEVVIFNEPNTSHNLVSSCSPQLQSVVVNDKKIYEIQRNPEYGN